MGLVFKAENSSEEEWARWMNRQTGKHAEIRAKRGD
jgi:hypothetical protein